jgi:alpha-amylase
MYRIFFRFMVWLIVGVVTIAIPFFAYAQQPAVRHKKTVFQGFWWDYWNNNFPNSWANYLTELAPRLKSMGVDAVWVPPFYKNNAPSSVGYSPFDHYDLGDKYQKGHLRSRVGTKDELLRMVAVLHANGIEVIEDMVLNHVDNAGSTNGAGGQDPEPNFSMQTAAGYKNFRYTSYNSPAGNESACDYLSRKGRWPKNYHNFHPHPGHNSTNEPETESFWGPDICYGFQNNGTGNGFGQSSNCSVLCGAGCHDPSQSSGYMRNQVRDWTRWLVKQTGIDGFRFDAVKHFPSFVTEDVLWNTQHNNGWASKGNKMFAVGEWVGSTSELDAWTSSVQDRAGTFDFGLRGFGSGQGIYGMIYGNGFFNLGSLPGLQQNIRFTDVAGERIHRTVPFVNNHDTYRPILNSNGNITGWNTGQELAAHIDPGEPRLAAAYAIIHAMDGNPQPFFEEVFNVRNTSKRWTHQPTNDTDLPVHSDLANIIKAHGALDFKGGVYKVRSAESNHWNVVTGSNSSVDHIVIERSGKAIIAATDSWNQDQESWVSSDFAPGTVLMDYSGGIATTSTVQADQRVNIKTRAVGWPSFSYNAGYANPGAHYHGYSIWAPVGIDFDGYTKAPLPTTQEWEMADDLGDSHCSSLGQGGMLPANSYAYRIVGKIFAEGSSSVSYDFFDDPVVTGVNNCIEFYSLSGQKLHCNCNVNDFSGNFTVNSTGWVVIKIRHNPGMGCEALLCGESNPASVPAQKAFVRVSYNAPAVVNTSDFPADLFQPVPFWTGAADDQNYTNPKNWEKCTIPALQNGQRVLYVNGSATGAGTGVSWTHAVPSLEKALDAAAQCGNIDEIWVAAGTYLPNTTANRSKGFKLPPGIRIYGGFNNTGNPTFADRNPALYQTILSGDIGVIGDDSDNVFHVVTLDATTANTVMDGFIIEKGNANGAGIHSKGGGMLNYGKLDIKNIVVRQNAAVSGGAALLNTGSLAILSVEAVSIQDSLSSLEGTVLNENEGQITIKNFNNIIKN